MLHVGLTGGIGSGKSSVAKFLAELNVPIIDADIISREITHPNAEAYQPIIDHFGKKILTPAGKINRQHLREIIFKSSDEKAWLEKLLHPIIIHHMRQQSEKIKAPYCVFVIPLLVESKKIDFIDRIVVVDVDPKVQIQRAQQRDQASMEEIAAIINSQSHRDQRLAMADDVITNDENLAQLKQKVCELHSHLLTLAASR